VFAAGTNDDVHDEVFGGHVASRRSELKVLKRSAKSDARLLMNSSCSKSSEYGPFKMWIIMPMDPGSPRGIRVIDDQGEGFH
jgi:hypothetical protein